MKIKADYTQLKDLGDNLTSSAEMLTTIMGNIQLINSKIMNNWIGIDSSMYLSRGENYVKQINMILEQMNESGLLINEAIADYQEVESEYEGLVGGV